MQRQPYRPVCPQSCPWTCRCDFIWPYFAPREKFINVIVRGVFTDGWHWRLIPRATHEEAQIGLWRVFAKLSSFLRANTAIRWSTRKQTTNAKIGKNIFFPVGSNDKKFGRIQKKICIYLYIYYLRIERASETFKFFWNFEQHFVIPLTLVIWHHKLFCIGFLDKNVRPKANQIRSPQQKKKKTWQTSQLVSDSWAKWNICSVLVETEMILKIYCSEFRNLFWLYVRVLLMWTL